MPAKIIRARDARLPSFVLPDFEDGTESFYPFTRLPEPQSIYQKLKKIILTATIFPIRLTILVTGLVFLQVLQSSVQSIMIQQT